MPLAKAVLAEDTAEVRKLLAQGADLNFRLPLFNAPVLTMAATAGKIAIIEALLAAGADANASTDKGLTPLLAAIQAGKTGVAQLLLKAGARK